MVSKYISNPLLVNGLKFHLRPYFLVYVTDCENQKVSCYNCYTFSEYKIMTARDPYIADDWTNTHIHLSGGHNTKKIYNWPDDFNLDPMFLAKCTKSLTECNEMICNLLKSVHMEPYQESKAGIKIFCIDMMLDDNGNAWLIEINSQCGFSTGNNLLNGEEYSNRFSTLFFDWIIKSVIKPHFEVES